MRSMIRFWLVATALLLPAVAFAAPDYRPGEAFEIKREIRMESATNDGSSGSSFDRDTLIVRVIGRTDAGVEVEYDLPTDISAEDRARQWEFPVRMLRAASAPAQLLNRSELEARVTAWLKAGGLTREACGRWYFTWNAFKIECDPNSVIATVEAFEPGPDEVAVGIPVGDLLASGAAALVLKSKSANGVTLVADLAIDPEAVRKARAESDVVVGEITRKPLTREAALKTRASDAIAGTIRITFETDPAGSVLRRTKVTTLTTTGPARIGSGTRTETRTTTEVLEWLRLSGPGAP